MYSFEPGKPFCNLCVATKGSLAKVKKKVTARRYSQTPQGKAILKAAARRHRLKHEYGLTEEVYEDMLRAQQGCCAICTTPQSLLKTRLAVDHCHATGRVRALLCVCCNQGLGMFKDTPDRLEAAIKYLKRFR